MDKDEQNVKHVMDFRIRRKKKLIELFGKKCCICGYDKIIEALEFHHIDANQKDFQITGKNCKSLQKQRNGRKFKK